MTAGVKHRHSVSSKLHGRPNTRLATPEYSAESLVSHMQAYISKAGVKGALDLQSYRGIKLSCAVNGRGILQNRAMIQTLINVCPFALYKSQDLKMCFAQMACEFEGLTGMLPRSTDRWASEMSERVMVLLNHLRRLRNSDVRLRQACGKLDEAGVKALKNLVNQVVPTDELVAVQSPKKEAKLSFMTADDDDDMPDSASDGLRMLLDIDPVPPAKLPKSDVKAKIPKVIKDLPSCKHAGHVKVDGVKYFATYGAKQSYIQYISNTVTKKKLLVAVSMSMATNHSDIVRLMVNHFHENPCTDKAKALSLRSALVV